MRKTQSDCYEYVRRTYGVPAYIGMRVRLETPKGGRKEGELVQVYGQELYVHIRMDGEKRAFPYHPTTEGLTYLVEGRL